MLDLVRQHDRPASPVRNFLDNNPAAQAPVVQKRLRSPRPAKKRQGVGAECAVDPAVATCSYGDDAVNGLSQLSDLVILDASQDANLSQDYPSAEVASQHFHSQEGHDASACNNSQVMLEAPPSQPDIPLASLAVSSAQADPAPEQAVNPFPSFSLPVQQPMVPQRLSALGSPSMQEVKDPNLLPLHPKSRATRRGPMDEMRQLVRILVKVIPHSVALISQSEEGGGGNRISEDQIKSYLENALGDAPKPVWGLPGGWGEYCAELFNWVLEPKRITVDQAMRCAKREPGRSWEAIESELNKLGLYPSTWPLPLTKQGLAAAAQNPVLQSLPSGPVPVKRQPNHYGSDGAVTIKAEKGTRRKVSGASAAVAMPSKPPAETEYDRLSEVEVWLRLQRLLEVAKQKQGTSSADDAMAVSSAQLQVHKLMQDFALPRPGLMSGMLAPPGGALLPLSSHGGPGPNEQLALVPVMIQNPDGTFTGAYQVQPYPSGFSTDGGPLEMTGFGGIPVMTAPPMALHMPLPSGPGTAFQTGQPLLSGGLTPPHSRSIAKPQPIRPRIGLPVSSTLPSAVLNGFQPDVQHAGSASPSTQDNDEEHRDFDIGSILRPTPVKAETVRRAGESQDAASQSLPIHSLHTPDLAALQGSQGIGTSLSALRNDLQHNAWQQLDGASQQHVVGQNGTGSQMGQPQEGSQQPAAALHSCNGGDTQQQQQAVQVSGPFDRRLDSSQQQSQQGSQNWEVGLLQMPPDSGSQQQARLPKRKLPFSVGVQPDVKRQSPGPDGAVVDHHRNSHGQISPPQATPDRPRNGSLAFVSPNKSPLGQSKAQLMSPSLLLVVAQQESPSHMLPQQQTAHTQHSGLLQ